MADEREWLDGPALAAWILERHPEGPNGSGWDDRRRRAVRRWRRGARASLDAADRMLIYLGRSLSELPEETWTTPPPRPWSPETPRDRRTEAVLLLRRGIGSAALARCYGVSARAIRHWRDEFAEIADKDLAELRRTSRISDSLRPMPNGGTTRDGDPKVGTPGSPPAAIPSDHRKGGSSGEA